MFTEAMQVMRTNDGEVMGSGGDWGKLEHYILSKVSVLQLQPTVAMRESRASMARPSVFLGKPEIMLSCEIFQFLNVGKHLLFFFPKLCAGQRKHAITLWPLA